MLARLHPLNASSHAGEKFLAACSVSKAATAIALAALTFFSVGAVKAEPTVAVASAPDVTHYALRSDVRPDVSKPLHLIFSLKSAKTDTIQAFIASQENPASPNYHKWISAEEFGKKFGASQADVDAVVAYAKAQGFTISNAWDDHMFVSVDTDVAHAESAFGVKINYYQRPAEMTMDGDPQVFFSPDSSAKVPQSIASKLDGILGLNNFVLQHAALSGPRAASKLIPLSGIGRVQGLKIGPIQDDILPDFKYPLGPADLWRVYNVDGLHNAGANGSGIKVGIYSPTGRYINDPQDFANYDELGTVNLTDVDIDGGPQDSNGATEASLDIETIFGQATSASIRIYDCPDSIEDRFDALNQMETDGVSVISASWGTYEDHIVAGGAAGQTYITGLQKIDEQVVADGIPIYNSADDTGAYDSTGMTVSVETEPAEPDTTAVGGTALPTDNNGYWSSETAWNYTASSNSGGGGGLSVVFKEPSYQAGPGVNNQYSDGYRQVPDISALGDPNTPGYEIVVNGALDAIGGTSASTPLWAGVNVLMNQLSLTTHFGSLNTQLYYIGTNLNVTGEPFAYHDITSGSDGVYSATTDWDYCTGWGSTDFTKLYDDLYLLPNYVPYNPGSGGPGGAWTSPIMIHASQSDVTEPATFQAGTPYYVAVAITDSGTADAIATSNSIQVDGTNSAFTLSAIPATDYNWNLAAAQLTFTAGTHTIKLIANTSGAKESSTTDDTYSRTINVAGSTGPSLVSVSATPNPVTSGSNATGTVTLSAAAPTGGASVTLSSNKSSDADPSASSVTVAAGATTANFTIYTAKNLTSSVTATISATYNSVTQTTNLTVNPASTSVSLVSVSATPNPVASGSNATGTVTLSGAAPTGGISVTLASNKSSDAVPSASSVTVPAGSTTANFTIYTAKNLTTAVTATISATYNSVTQTTNLTVNPATTAPALSSVTVTPNPVSAGTNATGTVTLTSAAPTGGIAVTLASDKSSDADPAVSSVTVAAGATTATFKIYTAKSLTTSITANISATYNSVTKTFALTVNPATTGVTLVSVTATPNPVTSGSNATGTVTLSGAAPTGGIAVTLASNKSSDAVPSASSVTVAAGATTANFTIYTAKNLTTAVTATISATYNSVTQTTNLTVNPVGGGTAALSSVSVSPTTVPAGTNATGTVTLTATAPTGGIAVALSSNKSSDAVPAVSSVTVAAGATTANFTIYTAKSLTTSVTATISAVYNSVTKTANITVTPATSGPTVTGISFDPSSIAPGGTTLLTVTLSAAAPAGGASVPITFAGSAYFTAVVPAGQTSVTYYASVSNTQAIGSVALTATYNGATVSGTLNIISEAWTLTGFSFDPDTINYGDAANGTVTFSSTVAQPTLIIFSDTSGYIAGYYIASGSSSFSLDFSSDLPDSTYTDTVTAQANGVSESGDITVLQ